jgi:hypothetical protein
MDAIWRFFMPRAQRSAVDNPPLFTIAAGLKEPSNTKSWPMKLAMNLKSKFAQAALGLWLAAPALALAATAAPEAAPDSHSDSIFSGWTFGYAPYTYHFSEAKKKHEFEPDVKHSYVWLVQAEKRLAGRSVAGLALFSNSFGQPSQYLYYGWRFTPLRAAPGVFFKLTGGVLHGYKKPFHRKIPLNTSSGWAFTIIPAAGYDFTPHIGAQVNVLGKSALMFQLNYSF